MTTILRTVAVWVTATATAAVGLVGGCTAPPSETVSGSPSSTSPVTVGSVSSVVENPAGARSPKHICEGAFGATDLLDWGPGTVANFRAYQFGGPKATVPLPHAFPAISGSTRGAWCGIRGGPDAIHWWAVVVGHNPATLITITGPGDGAGHGSIAAPPPVP